MVSWITRVDALLEAAVLVLQFVGFTSMILVQMLPACRWSRCVRCVFLGSLVGLGIAGAWCSQFDSEFALFAGGTMTVLLIGMTLPTAHADAIGAPAAAWAGEGRLTG